MSDLAGVEIVDVIDAVSFGLLPPCADRRFDHRSCDYWEDEVRGAKSARPSWWRSSPRAIPAVPPIPDDNPFVLQRPTVEDFNPFAPASRSEPEGGAPDRPRKLRLVGRGGAVFGSYAKVLLHDSAPAAYVQFGPLSAYPRAQRIRDLYPRLPQSPLPAVITCVATTAADRGRGLGLRLVEVVIDDLAARGFAAIEAYPDLTLDPDEASAASPGFWERCGFAVAVEDERYPVMRIELD